MSLKDMFARLDSATDDALSPPNPPPSPQERPSRLQSMFEALDRLPKVQATSNLLSAQDVTPDTAAAALRASRVIGIPQPAAEANLDQAKASAQLKANVDTLDQNPNLTNFIAENPLAARLAQDEFQKLGTLEQLATAFKTGLSGALMGNELGRLGNIKQVSGATGMATPEADRRIAGLQSALNAQPKLTGVMGAVQSFTGFMAGVIDNAMQGGTVGIPMGSAVGAALGSAAGGIGALPGAIAGAGVGAMAGFNMDMARVAAGNAYLKMEQMRGSDGQPLSEAGKQFGAVFTGAATYALGAYAGKIEARIFNQTAESLAQQAVAKAVTSPKFAQAIKTFSAGAAQGIAQGAGVMVAMEGSAVIGEEIAKAVSPGHFETNPGEIVERLAEAAINGAVLLGTMHGAMRGLSLYGDIRAARRAETQAEMFKNILDGSADTKLRERDLQAFQTFWQHQLDGTDAENVFIPAAKVRELYQGARIDPDSMTADPIFGFVPDMAKQLREIAEIGGNGDVVIPTKDFIANLAGSPVAERLLPDLRWGEKTMSVNEAKEVMAEYEKRMKAAVDEAGKTPEPDSAQKIADQVRQQALDAGYNEAEATRYGAIYAARYATRAERLGIDPMEAWKETNITIRRGTAEEARAGGEMRQERDADTEALIDMRKRQSVLNSILECLA